MVTYIASKKITNKSSSNPNIPKIDSGIISNGDNKYKMAKKNIARIRKRNTLYNPLSENNSLKQWDSRVGRS